jgi:hypothetical protein
MSPKLRVLVGALSISRILKVYRTSSGADGEASGEISIFSWCV